MQIRIVILGVLLVAGCVPQKKFEVVTDSDRVISRNGFQLYAPEGSWHLIEDTRNSIAFARKGTGVNDSYGAVAELLVIPFKATTETEFRDQFEYNQKIEMQDARYTLLASSTVIAPEKGPFCVKYHLKSIDHKPVTRTKAGELVIEIFGYSCRHPDNGTVALDWNYSLRAEPGTSDEMLEQRAEKFLNKVSMDKLNERDLGFK